MFLGVLGHDLRGPLNAILMTSQVMARLVSAEPLMEHTTRLLRSGERMRRLLDDLLDYSRVSLGVGTNIHRSSVDLVAACRKELDMLRSALPDHALLFEVEGNPKGEFDAFRIREALSNLVHNAASHGAPGLPIHVRLEGNDDAVNLSAENMGQAISEETSAAMFEPLSRGRIEDGEPTDRSHLGLGLFVVREIAKAHGGTVTGTCSDGKTTFRVTLGRSKP